MRTKLPKIALDFLKAHPSKKREPVIKAFHRYMRRWKLGFKDLKSAHIQSFISCPNKKDLSPSGREHYRMYLVKYLFLLRDKGLLRFDPVSFSNKPYPLPEIAEQHIRAISPTHKKSSIVNHRAALRLFHSWLERQAISLASLKREDMTAWLVELSQSNRRPNTINQRVIFVRIYLRSLYEQGLIQSHPDDLIRPSDRIKEPKHLPRPLPPAADRILQERLAASDNIYCQALLLMRKTGVRIGELSSLEYNCVRLDHLGNLFLKVPLGKLNTERLVPLDDSAALLIDKLKAIRTGESNINFLIQTDTGGKIPHYVWARTLKNACLGLETNGKMVTHRLRHTYATTLLSEGVSLAALMKLLGHNDYRMTLRYADITQETVGREYFEALSRIEMRYGDDINSVIPIHHDADPISMLSDIERLILKRCADSMANYQFARAVVKRIRRIQRDLKNILHISS